jgi:hypothetical protein
VPEENGSVQWNGHLRPNGDKVDNSPIRAMHWRVIARYWIVFYLYPLITLHRAHDSNLFMGVGYCIPISNVNEGLGTSGYSNLKKSDWTSALQPQVPFFYWFGNGDRCGCSVCGVQYINRAFVPPASEVFGPSFPFHQTVKRSGMHTVQ